MLSLVLTVRDWPVERVRASLASFCAIPASIMAEAIVVDFGSSEPLSLDGVDPRVRIVRLKAERWSLSEAINAGVLAARGDVIAKTDADVLLAPSSVRGMAKAAADLASGAYGILLAQGRDLPEEISLEAAIDGLPSDAALSSRLRPKWGQGLLTLFSRAAWEKIGGYDSRFVGWGEEDNDFCERVRQSGSRIGWVDREAVRIYHVWHPPTYMRTDVARTLIANRALATKDRSVFRSMRFRHSDPTPIATPAVLRRAHPLVTIAIATTGRPNRDRMIRECIDSFRGQIDDDFETLVVDNGSDDTSFAELKRTLKSVRWDAAIRLERIGAASIPGARNRITELARGRYICVIDDDDMALPNRLADHLQPFTDDGLLHGTHGGWIDYDEATGIIERQSGKQRTFDTLMRGRGKVTAHPASFYRTDVMRALPYDESFTLGCDWDLALRMGAMGLNIAHTGSYVTLRRFHQSNVTVTGTSSQYTSGQRARNRIWSLLSDNRRTQAVQLAYAEDGDIVCYNDMSLEEIVGRLPPYAGVWRLLLPFAALGGGSSESLEAVLGIIDGDLCTLTSGVNQHVVFRSEPIAGTAHLLSLRKALTTLLGIRPEIIADRQLMLDREVGFDWTTIAPPATHSVLVTRRYAALSDALEVMSRLREGSLLQKLVSVVSDHNGEGEGYYLVTAPQERTAARTTAAELLEKTGTSFDYRRTSFAGTVGDIGDRVH